MTKPRCFVLAPFGKKPGAAGSVIDFDAVNTDMIMLSRGRGSVESPFLRLKAPRKGSRFSM